MPGLLLPVLVFVLAQLPVVDYSYYVSASRAWASGAAQLYTESAGGFYYAPWALALTVPLSFLPDQIGQAVLNLLGLLGVAGATWALTRPVSPWQMIPAIANPFAAGVFILGQWDSLILAGIGLGWYGVVECHFPPACPTRSHELSPPPSGRWVSNTV